MSTLTRPGSYMCCYCVVLQQPERYLYFGFIPERKNLIPCYIILCVSGKLLCLINREKHDLRFLYAMAVGILNLGNISEVVHHNVRSVAGSQPHCYGKAVKAIL